VTFKKLLSVPPMTKFGKANI